MTNKYGALRAALSDHRLEYGFWFVEEDHLLFEDASEGYYHGVDPEDQALIKACRPETILDLLNERDSQAAEIARLHDEALMLRKGLELKDALIKSLDAQNQLLAAALSQHQGEKNVES